MNKTTLKETTDKPATCGAIYATGDDVLYILSIVGLDQYVAISLQDGARWLDVQSTVLEAISGLTFVCHEADITVEVKG